MMRLFSLTFILGIILCGCEKNQCQEPQRFYYNPGQFVMGADLSFTNQILDHNGVFSDSGKITNPYLIFQKYGANVIRFRLFYHPEWTRKVYGQEGKQMYSDFYDVKRAISRVKQLGMQVCLDFHYSDTWADPGKQIIPEAWDGLDLKTLRDSLYQYTYYTLKRLDKEGLMPEYIQPGNEINPGFLLPKGDRWHHTRDFIYLMNAAIQAIRDAGNESSVQPKVILHIAQPENTINWFKGLREEGLKDYDIIGFSYYYIWSTVPLSNISNYIEQLRSKYNKEVMIMETAYPWTTLNADNLGNIIATDKLLPDYPANRLGQYHYLVNLTREIVEGRGKGIFYWEPEWITSGMMTSGGQGSAWDCNTFFDFSGHVINAMNFMTDHYDIK